MSHAIMQRMTRLDQIGRAPIIPFTCANVKFVEDAARLLYSQLNEEPKIIDFRVVCSHFESLHSHDAVAVLCRGVDGGFRAEFEDFSNLNS